MTGNDNSQVSSGFSTNTQWHFTGATGVSYTWQVEVIDPATNYGITAPWDGGFSFGGSPQSGFQSVPAAGGPLGPEQIGGYNPSGTDPCACEVNQPNAITPGNGAVVETSEDLSVPGAGMPLQLTRTYDSSLAYLQTSGSTSPGPLGYGWSYNLGMSLSQNTSTQEVTVDQEDGSEITFTPFVSGSSPSWCLPSFNYCATAPRVLATLEQNANGSWTLTRNTSGQTIINFNSSGQLVSEQDAQGDTMSQSAESAGTGACPSSATSCTVWTDLRSARSLTLAFDSQGRLTMATYATTVSGTNSSNSVSYSYYSSGSSNGGTRDLQSTTLPGSQTTTYIYQPSASAPYVHFITEEDLPSGGTVSNYWNSSGQVYEQVAPSGTVSLSYSGSPAVYQTLSGGTTTVTTTPAGSPTSQTVVYSYSDGALNGETTTQTTSGGSTQVNQYYDLNTNVILPYQVQTTAATGESAPENTTNAFSSNGSMAAGDIVSSTDALGNQTLYGYNSYNQVWCKVSPEAVEANKLCPTSTTTTAATSLAGSVTIPVASTVGFNSAPRLVVVSSAGVQNVTCSGLVTNTSFTGCQGGTGTLTNGALVLAASSALSPGSDPWPGATVNLYNGPGAVSTSSSLATGTGTSLSVSPQTVGDLMVLTVTTDNATPPTVTSVSGGGVSSWSLAKRITDSAYAGEDAEIWTGVVTTAGASTISISLSGYSNGNDLTAQEFSAPSGSTWSVTSSAANTQYSTPFAYPSLTAGSGGELYYGMAVRNNSGTLSGGGTSGFTYQQSGLSYSDLLTYDTDAIGAVQPTGANTQSSDYEDVVGVLISATESGSSEPISALSGQASGSDQLLMSIDSLGRATAYAYTPSGLSVPAGLQYCSVSPVQYAAGVTCPAYGSPAAAGTTSSTFDSAGDVLTSTNPDGDTTTYTYGDTNHPGLATKTVDPDGTATNVTYNSAGQVTNSVVSFRSYSATSITGYTPGGYSYCTISPLAYSQGDTTCPPVTALAIPATGPSPPATSISLPQSTINVGSTTGFSTSSPIAFASNAGLQLVTCTGDTSTSFTGCSGGTGSVASGTTVVQVTSTAQGTDYWPGDSVTLADANNRPLYSVSPIGGVTQTLYDVDGNVFCTVSPQSYYAGTRCLTSPPTTAPTPGNDPKLGATLTAYNAAGQVQQVTNPLGGITLSYYDGDGNLEQKTVESDNSANDPNIVTTYSYNADNQVTQTVVTGSSQSSTTLQFYDPNGNVYCSVSPDAVATSAYSCPNWSPTWYEAPQPVTTLYSGSSGPSVANEVTMSFYDDDGELLQESNPDEATTISEYNADGQAWCTEDAADMVVSLQASSPAYPYSCSQTPVTSPPPASPAPGYESSIYDRADLVIYSTDAAGDTTGNTYDPDGQVLTETGPDNTGSNPQVTTNCFYWETATCAASAPATGGAASSLYSTTSPAAVGEPNGILTSNTYMPGGATATKTTAAGTATDTYDAAGDLRTVTYGASGSGYQAAANTSYTYFPSGLTQTMTDGTGTTTYAYDNDDDLQSSAFSAGTGTGLTSGTISYAYYATGDRKTLTYPIAPSGGSATVSYAYDEVGQLSSITDWYGHSISFGYDADGNTTSTAYPNNTAVGSPYDLGDVESSFDAYTGTPSSPGTSLLGANYIRSAEQVTTEGDIGALTTSQSYSYDSADRLGSTVQGTGNPVQVGYDAAGNPKALADSATQAFNNADQLTSATAAGGATTYYGYNATGDRTSASGSGSGPASISAVGTLATGTGGTLSVSPQATGDLMVLTVSTNNSTPPTVTGVSGGGVSSWSLAERNTDGSYSGFDSEIWTGVVTSTGSSTISISLSGYSNGNDLTAQEFSAGSGATWAVTSAAAGRQFDSSFSYPSLTANSSGELYLGMAVRNNSGTLSGGGTTGFSYHQSGLGASDLITYDTDATGTVQPAATNSQSGDYEDVTGVLISASGSGGSPAESFSYNQADELVGATVGSTTANYLYDATGLLRGRTTTSGTKTLSWDTSASPSLLLADGTNEYLYGPNGTPVEQVTTAAGSQEYVVSDGQGSTRALVNSSGAVAATFTFDPYGNLITSSGTATTPLLYGGQYEDQLTGLYYLRARWYDPSTDQFASVDPKVSETDEPYTYAGDDPVNNSDPTGLEDVLGDHATCQEVTDGKWSAKLCVQVNTSPVLGMNERSEPQAVWVVTSGAIENAGAKQVNMEVCGSTGPYPGHPRSCNQNDDPTDSPSATCGGRECYLNGGWYTNSEVNWEDAWVDSAWLTWKGGPRLNVPVSLHETPLVRIGNNGGIDGFDPIDPNC